MSQKTFYKLEIKLMGCHEEVTRTLIVPADIRLDYLSEVLLYTMGWRNAHLHEFQSQSGNYGMKNPDWDNDLKDERRSRLSVIAKPKMPRFDFIYDFGDNWAHLVEVVDFNCNKTPGKRLFFCTQATGACPPEDVGGTPGYEDFCAAINDPNHAEHEEMTDWVYGLYPASQKWPDGVSIDNINNILNSYERYYRKETTPKKSKLQKMWVKT